MTLKEFTKKSLLLRSTSVYNVYDYSQLNNLTISLTELHKNQHTMGHNHPEEEVYVFIQGTGKIELSDKLKSCKKGDIFMIPKNMFHKVYNTGRKDLKFLCVFEKYNR